MACTSAAMTDLQQALVMQEEMNRAQLLIDSARALRDAYVLRAWMSGASDGDAARVLGISRQAVAKMRIEYVGSDTRDQSEGQ